MEVGGHLIEFAFIFFFIFLLVGSRKLNTQAFLQYLAFPLTIPSLCCSNPALFVLQKNLTLNNSNFIHASVDIRNDSENAFDRLIDN